MKTLWKEWRQERTLLVLWCVAGLLFSLAQGLLAIRITGQFVTLGGTEMILVFGCIFALILATATTFGDVHEGLHDFWRSKPVSASRVLVTKFLVGAAVVAIAFLVLAIPDVYTYYRANNIFVSFQWNVLTYTYPVAVMVFSLTMLMTVLVRDAMKSVFVTIWLTILLYFLPLVIPVFGRMNLVEIIADMQTSSVLAYVLDPRHIKPGVSVLERIRAGFHENRDVFLFYLRFTGVFLGLAIVFVVLSIQAINRRWRWEPGQKTIVWALGLSSLVIFAAAMFQMGNNLGPVVSIAGTPINPDMRFNTTPEQTWNWLGDESKNLKLPNNPMTQDPSRGAMLCTQGDRMFLARAMADDSKKGQYAWYLDIFQHPARSGDLKHLSRTVFHAVNTEPWAGHQTVTSCFTRNNRLYVGYTATTALEKRTPANFAKPIKRSLSMRFLIADVSDPVRPKLISNREIDSPKAYYATQRGNALVGDYSFLIGGDELLVLSIQDPNQVKIAAKFAKAALGADPYRVFSGRQFSVVENRLLCVGPDAVMILDIRNPQKPRNLFYRVFGNPTSWDSLNAAALVDDHLFLSWMSGIQIYRLSPAADGRLSGELIGERLATPLEMVARRDPEELIVHKGMLFEAAGPFGLLAYDISDLTRPRRRYHAGENLPISNIYDIGEWQGQLYVANPIWTTSGMTFLSVPSAG